MKKTLALIFITINVTGYSQHPIEPVLRSYFQTHPFNRSFTSFITSLQKNRWFKIEEFTPRTDTSLFFLTGTYKYFNPFRYIPEELRLAIVEEQIGYPGQRFRDTIFSLQLSGITDTGKSNRKIVQKEFRRFQLNQAERFKGFHSYERVEDKGQIVGEVYKYYILPFYEPLTIAWNFLQETNQYAFTITIRFKLKQNMTEGITVRPKLKT